MGVSKMKFLSVFVAAATFQWALGLKVNTLGRGAAARTETIALSFYALETVGSLPKNATKEQETKVVKALEGQVDELKKSVVAISKMDKKAKSTEEQAKSKNLKSHMKEKDQEMMNKFDDWSERMNRKTRLGAMDVISKLENAIHFVKKGALSGNADAEKGLNAVLEKMGNMA